MSSSLQKNSLNLRSSEPIPVPYLIDPPEVVDIRVGRQLFVDDYLIGHSSFTRVWHQPVKYPCNPVLTPESAEERSPDFPACAVAKCGGVWYDDAFAEFRMWYMTGYLGYFALATSRDGLHWERPALDIHPGTNLLLPHHIRPDSGSVVIDHTCENPQERYKLLLREANPINGDYQIPALAYVSADGIHWEEIGKSGPMQDRSTMYYDPFRQKWVQSIRYWDDRIERFRLYHDGDTFADSLRWTWETALPWLRADCFDQGAYHLPQLYNHDAIAYESLMISCFQILHGPPNHEMEKVGLPKLTELYLATSRDGYHWHRPERRPFIGARREYGSWEYGYVESSAGMFLIVGDEIWIYYSAYGGDPTRTNLDWRLCGTYGNGAVGLAKLRRDGFASMRPGFPGAEITTRRLLFEGSRLFVNASTVGTILSAEVRDRDGAILPGLSHDDCLGFLGNATCAEIRWKDRDLAGLGDSEVCLNFRLERGDFYAFWITDNPTGKSGGYTAGGGPGLKGGRDI